MKSGAFVLVAAMGGLSIYAWMSSDIQPLETENGTEVAGEGSSARRDADAGRDLRRLNTGLRLKSIDAMEAALVLSEISDSSKYYYKAQKNIAHIRLTAGHNAEAASILESLLQTNPDDIAMLLAVAEIRYELGDWKKALPSVQNAIRLQPTRPQSHILLAKTLDELGRIHEMVEPLREAVRLSSESWPAHILLAYATVSTGALEEADQAVQWCLKRNNADPDAIRYNAMLLRARGNHDAALVEIRRAIELLPEDAECRQVAADILLFKRRSQEAYDVLLPVYEKNKNRRTYLGTLMRAAAMAGLGEEASEYRKELQDLMTHEDAIFTGADK